MKISKKLCGLTALCGLAMGLSIPGATSNAVKANVSYLGNFYVQTDSLEDALENAGTVAEKIAAEGDVLLKNNDDALPLSVTADNVSIFGISSDATPYADSKTVSLADAMEEVGFNVNPVLKNFYANNSLGFTNRDSEVSSFSNSVESSYHGYSDVAIVFWSVGAGGEGYGDGSTGITGQYQNANSGDHVAPQTDAEGKALKHELQMYDQEIALRDYVKKQGFRKIVYVIASWTPVEAGLLQDDDDIDSILYVGAPSETGNRATAKILAGIINPSGKTADTWYRDFTADPTWANACLGNQANRNVSMTGATDPDDLTVMYDANGQLADNYLKSNVQNWAAAILGTGVNALDYEEDVYMGYRYYETRAAEMNKKTAGSGDAWYQKAVVYPFGYGLSYSSFKYSNMTLEMGGTDASGHEYAASDFASSKTLGEAKIKTAKVKVTVTNTGFVAGKQTVEIYASAPYTGKVQKPSQVLVGYGKTATLNPGKSETLEIEINVQDFASYDASGAVDGTRGGYVLEGGDYTISALGCAHDWAETESATKQEVSFSIDGDASLDLDDFSGNEITNKFSKENGAYSTFRDNAEQNIPLNVSDSAKMTRLNRDDLGAATDAEIASYPQAPTDDDLSYTAQMLNSDRYWMNYGFDDQLADLKKIDYDSNAVMPDSETKVPTAVSRKVHSDGDNVYWDLNGDGEYSADELVMNLTTDAPWIAEADAAMAGGTMDGWTQSTTENVVPTIKVGDDTVEIRVADLAGLDQNDTTPLTSGKYKGKTPKELWTAFMNSYSFAEMDKLVNVNQKQSDAAKGMNALGGADNCHNYGSSFEFGGKVLLAQTFNQQLAYEEGNAIGNIARQRDNNAWWGTGVQLHRHYFAGRNHEYMAEDPYLVGMQAAGEVQGCQETGTICIVKHAMLNDQEAHRGGTCPHGWISEEAFRQLYLKSFEICFQAGGAQACMTSMSRIGRICSSANYNFMNSLVKEEWGQKDVSFTTDIWISVSMAGNQNQYCMAGCDNVEASVTFDGSWDADNGYVGTTIGDTSYEDKYQWYAVRKAAMNFVKLHANSAINKNGVYFDTWALSDGKGKVGESFSYDAGYDFTYEVVDETKLPAGMTFNTTTGKLEGTCTNVTTKTAGSYSFEVNIIGEHGIVLATDIVTYSIAIDTSSPISTKAVANEAHSLTSLASYSITAGNLPDGLTLDTSTGKITGIPTKAGTYTVTVQATIDGVISDTREIKFTIDDSFILEGEASTYTASKIYLDSDYFDIDDGYEFSASVVDGQLPTGMTISGDTISGTPEKAGTYTATLAVVVNKNGTVVGTYYTDVTIVVAEGVNPEKTISSVEEIDGGHRITFSDGSYIDVLNGEKGDTGETGATGAQGEKGDKGDTGETGATGATGAQGEKGEKGDKGDKGDTGEAGAASSGCGGSVIAATSAIGAVTLIGAALALKKRKEDK